MLRIIAQKWPDGQICYNVYFLHIKPYLCIHKRQMKKLFIAAGLALVMVSCKKEIPEAGSLNGRETKKNERSRLAGNDKIKLLKSWSVYAWVYHGAYNKEKSFYAEVANIAYQKQVFVHHKMADGTWADLPLRYHQAADAGTEIWKLDTSYGGYYNTYITANQDFGNEFVLKYIVNGETYWDNNKGQNYKVNNPYSSDGAWLREGVNILADSYKSYFSSFNNMVTVYADLRNLAYQKNVTLVYTTDDWRTVRRAPLNFMQYYSTGNGSTLANPNAFGIERWSVNLTLEPAASKISYALSYQVAGAEYWDNNFGRNYTLYKR